MTKSLGCWMVATTSKRTGRCALTGIDGTFVDAHLIPKAFYATGGQIRSYASDGSRLPKRARIGLYDPSLVIAQTEKEILSPLDDYGVRFMRREVGKWYPLENDGRLDGWIVDALDYDKLKLFFNSVLWRFAVSKMAEPELDLGEWTSKLHQLVASSSPGPFAQFAVSIVQYWGVRSQIVMTPIIREIDGSLGVLAFFGGAEVLWYVEPPTVDVEKMRLLRPNEPLVVLNRGWAHSRPEQMFKELALANRAFD